MGRYSQKSVYLRKMKILVTGANGQLGKALKAAITMYQTLDIFIFADRTQLDISQTKHIQSYLDRYPVDAIVNCAAYTSVDQAECERESADQINHLSVKQLAVIAHYRRIKLVHISTDYVFDGSSSIPYTEDQKAYPLSVYGASKRQGEQAIENIMDHNALIIRTSWMYSEYGKNFVKTILELGLKKSQIDVIDDQIGTPTYALDLAHVIIIIIQSQYFRQASFITQLYHYANQESCSWHEFAQTIFQMANINCEAIPITTSQYRLPASRPVYSVLNTDKIKKDFNLEIPKWKISLKKCIDRLR